MHAPCDDIIDIFCVRLGVTYNREFVESSAVVCLPTHDIDMCNKNRGDL